MSLYISGYWDRAGKKKKLRSTKTNDRRRGKRWCDGVQVSPCNHVERGRVIHSLMTDEWVGDTTNRQSILHILSLLVPRLQVHASLAQDKNRLDLVVYESPL